MDLEALFAQPAYRLFRQAIAERKAPLVIICGSGLSAPAGLPTWPTLRANLIREADYKFQATGTIGKNTMHPKLESLKNQTDFWVTFRLLRQFLGKGLFESLVERELTPADDVPTPSSYSDLLRLEPAGLVTLNLDKFAGDAIFAQSNSPVTPVYGLEIARKWNELRSYKTFLVYLHGGLHDPSTWIMTQDDLDVLSASEGHSLFLKSVFADNVVLFAGVSADDIALSGRLIQLTTSGFRPKHLYWLTSRGNDVADWANASYVKLIEYSARTNNEHASAIKALVTDCLTTKLVDRPEPPLVRPTDASQDLAFSINSEELTPDDLAQCDPETIRKTISALLNSRLLQALNEQEAFQEYRGFCDEYDFALDRAFYRGKADKHRQWFGYKLEASPLGRGNFGEVYSAQGPGGELVAVKIMHKSIFGNDDMLAGFRRGVRSMNIVTEHHVKGMVSIIDSFELPPTIVMPYVPGISFEDVVRSGVRVPWITTLDMLIAAGRVVSSGHALPQTVLHRDLKPSNIMVDNFEYNGSFNPNIVVLDFDMSWHKGSKEKDVVFESRDDFGYLAPEQTDKTSVYSAKSTRVDSYGFGMTMFYMFGHEAPRPNEALSEQWRSRAARAIATGYDQSWRSAPTRLGRLVARATAIEQNLRVDFATILHELEYIRLSVTEPENLSNPEVWAEETLSYLAEQSDYVWDDALGRGSLARVSGINASVTANFRSNSVELAVGFVEQGFSDRSKLSKYLSSGVQVAVLALESGHWKIVDRKASQSEAFVRAEISVSMLQTHKEQACQAATEALFAFHI